MGTSFVIAKASIQPDRITKQRRIISVLYALKNDMPNALLPQVIPFSATELLDKLVQIPHTESDAVLYKLMHRKVLTPFIVKKSYAR